MRYILCGLLCAFLFVAPARAETTIGVLDVQYLMTQSKASAHIRKQLTDHREDILKTLKEKEKGLIDREKKLIENRKTLSEEKFSEEVQAFEKDKMALQKMSMAYNRNLSEASAKAERTLMEEIVQISGKLAEENKYSLIISKQQVIVGSTALDVTEEAMKRLNKALPKVEVPLSK